MLSVFVAFYFAASPFKGVTPCGALVTGSESANQGFAPMDTDCFIGGWLLATGFIFYFKVSPFKWVTGWCGLVTTGEKVPQSWKQIRVRLIYRPTWAALGGLAEEFGA